MNRPNPTNPRIHRFQLPTATSRAPSSGSDVARDSALDDLSGRIPSPEPTTEDRLVPEEGVLDAGLAVIAGFLLPASPPHRSYPRDCPVARCATASPSPAADCGLRGRHNDRRPSRAQGTVDGSSVVDASSVSFSNSRSATTAVWSRCRAALRRAWSCSESTARPSTVRKKLRALTTRSCTDSKSPIIRLKVIAGGGRRHLRSPETVPDCVAAPHQGGFSEAGGYRCPSRKRRPTPKSTRQETTLAQIGAAGKCAGR